jgi:transposase
LEERQEMLTMTDYHKIRVAVENEQMSQREVARKFGHGRDTIRKILADTETQPQYRRKIPPATSLDPYHHIIDEWLKDEADRGVPRKQRSNALKLQQRLKEEHGYPGSVYPVRRYLRKRARNLNPQQVFYTLDFKPGEEAQVDWGQASVILGDSVVTVHLFCLRLAYSRATFVRAYPNEKLECFMDGHVRAFRHFGGVPKQCAYDNLKSAVTKTGKKQERVLNRNFQRLLAHYAMQARFCNVDSGNEKGRVENLVKLVQQDFLAGAPRFRDFDSLNAHLERCCLDDLKRLAPHSDKTRQRLLEEETSALLPLRRGDGPAYTSRSTFAGKDALVQFEKNFYSVPVSEAYANPLQVRGYADRVEVWKADGMIAVHPRLWESGKFGLDFRHFIPLLEAKPGGLANARVFQGEPWGEDFSRFRAELNYRNPDSGEREFVDLLLLFTRHPEADVRRAVAECARLRAWSVSAVESAIAYVEPSAPKAMDMSRWPGLSLETDGVRPASEYDAVLLASEPPEVPPVLLPDLAAALPSDLASDLSADPLLEACLREESLATDLLPEVTPDLAVDPPSALPSALPSDLASDLNADPLSEACLREESPATVTALPGMSLEISLEAACPPVSLLEVSAMTLSRYDRRFGVSAVLFPAAAERYDRRVNWRGGPGA